MAEAERIYTQILVSEPDVFDALHLRGLIYHQRGDHRGALSQIDAALRIDPDNLLGLNNRGLVLDALGRFDEALVSYARALSLRPDFAEALLNRGNTLRNMQRLEPALASFNRAIAARPGYADAHYNRGNTLFALNRLCEALASYDAALEWRPNFPEVHCSRGIVLHALNRFDEALAACDRALALRPDYAEAYNNRGVILHATRRFDEALVDYGRALELNPRYADAFRNQSATLCELRRFEKALQSCDRTLALCTGSAEIHYNRGNALKGLQRFSEAAVSYERALELRPNYLEALNNRGVALHQLKRFSEELTQYNHLHTLRPDFSDAHYNESLCRLLIGDFERGWQKHEWRWQTAHMESDRRNFVQPLWLGSSDIAGKTILLHAEQGFGDTIQFCRYAPLVAARGARVILEVQEPLRELISTLSAPIEVVSRGHALPNFDMHCPLLSLPLAFSTQLSTIPSATPYLRAEPAVITDWKTRLGSSDGRRIGLAWSGRPTHTNDHNRSIPLKSMLPLLDGIDATFVSLQREIRPADTELLRGRNDVLHFGNDLKNFGDTAALIANLDLIIAVDTSVAHLAGALAKPVWMLLPYTPDWRWLLDRDDSPWYPTARLFRQDETRQWEPVITEVHACLREC
ncbi:MAG TPA: tetratricopeptide repeat protein [Xanthobacteraceae bacterium]|nr:tetratricopeptide repeat protein [Xanthobacteraceae bacterium]